VEREPRRGSSGGTGATSALLQWPPAAAAAAAAAALLPQGDSLSLSVSVSSQVTKKLANTAAWVTNVANEHGQVLVSVLTCAEGEGRLPRHRDGGRARQRGVGGRGPHHPR